MAGSVSYTTTKQELVAAFRADLVRNFVSPRNLARFGLVIVLIYISDYSLYLLPRRAFSDDHHQRPPSAGRPARAPRPPAPRACPALPTGWPLMRWLTQSPPPRPGLVALLWVIATALDVLAYVLFRDAYDTQSVLYLSGALVLRGLLAGWAMRLRAGRWASSRRCCKSTSPIRSWWSRSPSA